MNNIKRIMLGVILLLISVVALTSCTEDESNFCEVTVVSGEGGTAKIYPDNSTHKIVAGWWVELIAKSEKNYRFVNWTVNGKEVSTENPYKATINTSTQFKANFEKDNFSVKVLSSEGGKATASQEGEVLNGTKVTFTATPNEGYSFVNWTVNGKEVSTKNPYTLTITEDLEIKANFITHKIIVTTSEGGTAEADKTQVGNNEKVTFTATPNEGYSFVNWTVNGKEVSTKNPYTTTITEGISIKANFKALHKVSVIASEGGSANASQTGEVLNSTEVTFTATSQENYGFVNWTVNGKEVSTENPYKVTITDSISIKANFATYKVNVLSSEGGTAKADKTQVGHNKKVTFTATANEGYSFANWTVEGKEVSKENPYTTTITEGIAIKANFITHKIIVTSSEGGTAESDKTQVGHNEKVTFTATANEGYSFVNWTVNGKVISSQKTYITTITDDIEIKANFDFAFGATGLNNNKGYVDLGLSVKWATCNVGANTPEGRGNYYAWGETETKAIYNWDYYKYYDSTKKELSVNKYCTNAQNGVVDNKDNLELSDDVAHVNWGSTWRMPTGEEWNELASNCKWERIKNDYGTLIGFKAISKINGNSIFFCVTGYRVRDALVYSGDKLTEAKEAHYWIASLSNYSSIYGVCMKFTDLNNGSPWLRYESRCYGMVVRAVCP